VREAEAHQEIPLSGLLNLMSQRRPNAAQTFMRIKSNLIPVNFTNYAETTTTTNLSITRTALGSAVPTYQVFSINVVQTSALSILVNIGYRESVFERVAVRLLLERLALIVIAATRCSSIRPEQLPDTLRAIKVENVNA